MFGTFPLIASTFIASVLLHRLMTSFLSILPMIRYNKQKGFFLCSRHGMLGLICNVMVMESTQLKQRHAALPASGTYL